jgi:hypothetical protein
MKLSFLNIREQSDVEAQAENRASNRRDLIHLCGPRRHSDIVLVFEKTEEDLVKRMKAGICEARILPRIDPTFIRPPRFYAERGHSTHIGRLAELERSHAELWAALILAGREIRRLNFGRAESVVLKKLRAVLRKARQVAKANSLKD